MDFKDYYATLGVPRTVGQDEIKRAYRKLARKHHPDLNKEPHAEDRFKEVAEAHEALIDPERRAAYDELQRRHEQGRPFEPSQVSDGAGQGAHGNADLSSFFESLFGRTVRRAGFGDGHSAGETTGEDHHAKVVIDLDEAYRGAKRTMSLRMPAAHGDGSRPVLERRIEVDIPKGMREGQHLRLAGQGLPGHGGGSAGDLYLEISLRPQPPFEVEGGDVYTHLQIAPWEAALGATVPMQTPEGEVQLTVPAGSSPGRKLRLKGKGLPGKRPGDLYAVLGIAVPKPHSADQLAAYEALARAFAEFDPRPPQ